MSIPVDGYSHVRLTVTDIARSRAFYDAVFDLPVAYELPPDADEATRQQLWFLFGGVIYQLGSGVFGLRPVAPGTDRFDEDRVGLDHVSFAVADRAVLETAAVRLDELGVPHSGVKDAAGAPCSSSATPTASRWRSTRPADPSRGTADPLSFSQDDRRLRDGRPDGRRFRWDRDRGPEPLHGPGRRPGSLAGGPCYGSPAPARTS